MTKQAAGSLLLSLSLDRSGAGYIRTQLYSQIRDLILSGHLKSGERIPASRILARDYGVARSTIADVYDRLAAEGLVQARVGSGTHVARIEPLDPSRWASGKTPAGVDGVRRAPRLSSSIERAIAMFHQRLPHRRRCFTTAMPDLDSFPVAAWTRIVSRIASARRHDLFGYCDPCGLPELRRAIAAHARVNRGIECEPGQVFIFSGAQQAIHFVSGMLLDPGDKVWFENPGAIGARNSLVAVGADIVPVPIDGDGLIVAAGLAQAPHFRLAFVTPTHQQPLATLMSIDRRLQLLAAAERADAAIIEDDYDGEFYYGRHPVPALKSIDRGHRVIYVGSFSKSLFPALRLGYAVVPPPLIDTFEKAIAAFLSGVPTQVQAAVAAFIDSGQFSIHLRSMRRTYLARYQALLAAADRYLRGRMHVARTEAGLHTIALLERPADEMRIAVAADRKGITVVPLGTFCVSPIRARGFVLGFSGTSEAEIMSATRTLARVI